MKKSDIFWQSYLSLEKEALEISKYIYVTDVTTVRKNGVETEQPYRSQLETFSPHIADLLVRCCVQIEAISKELYFENGGEKQRGDTTIQFDVECLKLVDKIWETHKKAVLIVAPLFHLTDDENKELKPLREAHKWQGTYWERCYQAVKHDRVSSLSKGNVKAFLHALAALYLLNLYYRNESWVLKYEEISKRDYSMGSALFAVRPPAYDGLWEDNKARVSESPYVVQYQDNVYQQIDEIREKENRALQEYWDNIPEWKDQNFITYMKNVIEEKKGERVIGIWELAKYRLNKKIPNSLPFEERKSRLLISEEWNGRINQQNHHLSAEEINEDNIQGQINLAAIHWGMEITLRFQKMEWLQMAMFNGLCKVYIPKKGERE